MLAAVSTAQVPRLSPACLPGSYAADTTTRSGMTSTGTSPDMRLGSPRRASWLGANSHSRTTLVQYPSHTTLPSRSVFLRPHTPTFHPAPQHRGPKRPPFPSPCPHLHAWNSSCAALAGTWTAGCCAASFRGARIPGVFCLGSGYRGGAFCFTSTHSEPGAGIFARILHC